MSPLVVCVAVVLYRSRRSVSGPDHVDDAPPIAVVLERRPVPPADVASRHAVPIDEFYDLIIDTAAGLQRVLNRRPSETARMSLQFFRMPRVQRIYCRWQNKQPFPTLAQFATLCRAFSPDRQLNRLDAAACAAALRTLEILALGDPPTGRVFVDAAERSFYFVSPRTG